MPPSSLCAHKRKTNVKNQQRLFSRLSLSLSARVYDSNEQKKNTKCGKNHFKFCLRFSTTLISQFSLMIFSLSLSLSLSLSCSFASSCKVIFEQIVCDSTFLLFAIRTLVYASEMREREISTFIYLRKMCSTRIHLCRVFFYLVQQFFFDTRIWTRVRRGEGGGKKKVEKYGVAWKGFCEFSAINLCW
jgi:hypothetical protein